MAAALMDEPYGCPHYKRKCKLVAPCCSVIYTCRFCHDDKESHPLNRKAVEEVICMICETRQKVRPFCAYCEVVFGEKHFCLECRLFDDENKNQFHCTGCGICRVGGRENFFHCKKCNMCLNWRYFGSHQCIENRSRTECPVCLDNMHYSRTELYIPDCGHLLHKACYEQLEENGFTVCPTCRIPIKNK